MIKNLIGILLLASLCDGITRIIYSNSNCGDINAIEKFSISECRILSLGGQLFSVKINICNATNWQTSVFFNSLNCSDPHDLVSNGPSNRCFFSESNLYEQIICNDIIGQQANSANYYNLFILFLITFIIILF